MWTDYPGSESSRVLSLPGTKVPDNFRSSERKFPKTFVPGSESSQWELSLRGAKIQRSKKSWYHLCHKSSSTPLDTLKVVHILSRGGSHVAKASAAIGFTLRFAAEHDSVIDLSEDKKNEKISISWMHNVCSYSNWHNLSIFLTISKLHWIITVIITCTLILCNTSQKQQQVYTAVYLGLL